ncbi:MAG: DUF1292 domain-containing protein [Anaerostipes sp.]|jgi:uncharacterized protein YrzB (UPF0473 family)|nr:DUF1292 domain-containing protein [Anaerostipes sp.]MDD3746629.1 DUF1292 domain-containing protein [Anaerostipes sp.]MDD4371830.1 DUF1292 domain-containing protein [Anaerostipes sp.]
MSEDQYQEDEMPVIHLELDNGQEEDCAVVTIFGIDDSDQDYIALVPVQDLEDEETESRLLLYRFTQSSEDDVRLDNIEDDDEYNAVTAAFDALLEDDE